MRPISTIHAGFLLALASAALFAIRPIFVKLVYADGVDPLTLIGLRMAFSVPIYAALLAYYLTHSERDTRLSLKLVVHISVLGLFGYFIASYLDLLGLQTVSAQLGRLILYTYPTFAVILGALWLGQRITLRTVLALWFTYLGVGIIFGHELNEFGSNVTRGALWILASALCFSVYLVGSKQYISQVGSKVFTCIALMAASLGIFIYWGTTHFIQTGSLWPDEIPSTYSLTVILAIAIFCTVIPTFFTAAAIARIGSDRTGIVAMVGPGLTSVFAVSILGEAFTVYHLAGMLITVVGVALLPRN